MPNPRREEALSRRRAKVESVFSETPTVAPEMPAVEPIPITQSDIAAVESENKRQKGFDKRRKAIGDLKQKARKVFKGEASFTEQERDKLLAALSLEVVRDDD